MTTIHLSKTNFEEKVLKTDTMALVDFWAEWCIAPNTLISRDLRHTAMAKDIKKDDELINYKNGLSNDRVNDSKIIKNGGHCRKIKTERGRQIETTDDHLFYTDEGWKTGQDLQIGDRVAVFPGLESIVTAKNRKILVNEKDIVEAASRRMIVKTYTQELKEKGLLPLRMDNDKLPILARLSGFLFTDGTLYQQRTNNFREISFCLGEEKDVEAVIKDLNILGYKGHVSEKQSFQEIEGRKFTARTKGIKCLSTSLWLLFKALSVPEGNKTNQAYSLPSWLLKSPKDIKREFLAGFLGGDGPKLIMFESFRKIKKSFNSLTINDLEFYKRIDLEKEGIIFGKQLKKMLEEFGVEIIKIFWEPTPYIRKDKTKTISIHLRFRQNFETGYNMVRNIGYAYCWQKWRESNKVGEFLRLIMEKRKNWQKIYQRAICLNKDGFSPGIIAKKLNVSIGAVWNWFHLGRKPTISKHFQKFPFWIKKVSKNLGEGFYWDYIIAVKKIYLPVVQRISVKENYNFIANEFLVHNCGPCRMVGPIIDELALEYKDKIVVGKINVDEEQELAGEYGVMSIPTVIILKDGKEIERQVGFMGKEAYQAMIDKWLIK